MKFVGGTMIWRNAIEELAKALCLQ